MLFFSRGRSISPDPSLLHVSEPSGPGSKGCAAEPFTDQPDAGRSEQGGLFKRSGCAMSSSSSSAAFLITFLYAGAGIMDV